MQQPDISIRSTPSCRLLNKTLPNLFQQAYQQPSLKIPLWRKILLWRKRQRFSYLLANVLIRAQRHQLIQNKERLNIQYVLLQFSNQQNQIDCERQIRETAPLY